MAKRIIAIGDLNGSLEALVLILRGLRLINREHQWIARNTHLVQVGDIFNRGSGAKQALELLLQLQEQATARKSQVSILLGNHEVMTAMGNEAYCTVDEYLSFATMAQRRAWPGKVHNAMRKLYHTHAPEGPILPLHPRVEAWKVENAPGQRAMRRALGPHARLGRSIRKLPIALLIDGFVFSHAPVTPRWARLGVEGINAATLESWDSAPSFYGDFPRGSILSDRKGPLWNRSMIASASARSKKQLTSSLNYLNAKRMIVGHTMTENINGGEHGVIKLCQRGKLVCIDVGLGRRSPTACTALLIENGSGFEWTPNAKRPLWK